MSRKMETPDFKTEEEEALWWEQNEDLLLAQFEQAAKEGTLERSDPQQPVSSWGPTRLRKTA